MKVRKNLRQHRTNTRKSSAPKEEPGEANKMKRQHHSAYALQAMRTIVTFAFLNFLTIILMSHQSEPVNTTPYHKVQACSVPQSAQKHGDNKIYILPNLALTITSERDINVVANPRRQRNMPASPKVSYAVAFVRSIEVHRESET